MHGSSNRKWSLNEFCACRQRQWQGFCQHGFYRSKRKQGQPILDIAFLRVCRQIYRETALIPYITNTFSFADGHALDLFVSKALISPQRKAIQHLQIDGWLSTLKGPSQSVRKETVRALQGVKRFDFSAVLEMMLANVGLEMF
jgi:hypothetical protein